MFKRPWFAWHIVFARFKTRNTGLLLRSVQLLIRNNWRGVEFVVVPPVSWSDNHSWNRFVNRTPFASNGSENVDHFTINCVVYLSFIRRWFETARASWHSAFTIRPFICQWLIDRVINTCRIICARTCARVMNLERIMIRLFLGKSADLSCYPTHGRRWTLLEGIFI